MDQSNKIGVIRDFRSKNFKAVNEACQSRLETNPDDFDAFIFLGILSSIIHDPNETIRYLSPLIESDCGEMPFLYLGQAYFRIGELDKALKLLNIGINKYGCTSHFRFLKAFILKLLGDLEAAAYEFSQARERISSSQFITYGEILERLGRTSEAIDLYRVALNDESVIADTNIWHKTSLYLAEALRSSGQADIATSIIEKIYPTYPHNPNLQVSSFCNLDCVMCPTEKWEGSGKNLELDMFRMILARLKAANIDWFRFTSPRGEPLLNKNTLKFIKMAQSNGIDATLTTNGTALTESNIREIAELELNYVQVSFAGYDKKSYESIYVNGKFDNVAANIKRFQKTLREKFSTTHLVINGMIPEQACTEEHPRDIARKTMEYLRSLGIVYATISHPNNFGGEIELSTGNDAGSVSSYKKFLPNRLRACKNLLSAPGIYLDGTVTACGCFDHNGSLYIGDLKTRSLDEIFSGRRYQEIVRAFIRGDISGIPLCKDCDIPYGLEPNVVLEEMSIFNLDSPF